MVPSYAHVLDFDKMVALHEWYRINKLGRNEPTVEDPIQLDEIHTELPKTEHHTTVVGMKVPVMAQPVTTDAPVTVVLPDIKLHNKNAIVAEEINIAE